MHFALRAAVAALALTTVATTAAVASSTPGRVEPVQIVEATTTSLTLEWPAVSSADAYQVELGTNEAMSNRRLVGTAHAARFTVTNLTPGSMYCFNVRALSGRTAGQRSPKTCKPTIAVEGPSEGADYRVLTYNLCSVPCGGWSQRRAAAVETIRANDPDVIALQETFKGAGVDTALADDYSVAQYKCAKWLLYRTSRFTYKRGGFVDLGHDPGATRSHWAVWADLADRENKGKRVIFVSVHTAAGEDTATIDGYRAENVRRVIEAVTAANPYDYPVVYAGDFNSHTHRRYDSPTRLFNQAGYSDAFNLAETLLNPNFNSVNQLQATPRLAYTYGDHVDHFWVRAETTRVLEWRTASIMDGSRYATPIPSDHNPSLAEIVIG